MEKRPAQLKVAVTLDNSSRSLLELAKRLLEELGVECAGPWKKDRRGGRCQHLRQGVRT